MKSRKNNGLNQTTRDWHGPVGTKHSPSESPQVGRQYRKCFAPTLMMLALLGIGLGNSQAQEQDIIETGKREFQRSCATCHGVDAKGDGPAANVLNVKPSDLTQMKKRHGGVFLFWRTYEKISGRDEEVIRGHGTREMPIWGERFRLDRDSSEEYQSGVRGRILSLVYYLQSIQEP